jgi:glycerol-1-phosphate dehydrogenase [NAD(P)+]
LAEADVRRAHPPGAQADQAVAETLAKHPTEAQLRSRLERLVDVWPALRAWLQSWRLTPSEARLKLDRAGCPTDPRAIGLDLRRMRESYALARQVRTRYTVLDLAVETGLLEPALGSLFSERGFWGGGPSA